MGVKKHSFITVEFQTINVEETMEVEKSQFGKHCCDHCFRPESLMDTKISGRKYEKK